MDREIKFRAWLKEEKRMLYKISSIKFDIKCIYYDNNEMFSYEREEFKDIELMQYTGLKDKNGVEIYEGDIVKINDDYDTYGKNAGEIYEVYFNAGGFRLKPKYDTHKRGDRGFWLDDGNDVAILGNIYENKELLGEN